MSIKNGDTVVIEYTGRFTDGTVFIDSRKNKKPLVLLIGSDEVIEGMEELIEVFEEAITGLKIGQETEFEIDFNDYGDPYDDQLVKKVPVERFPDSEKMEVGKTVNIEFNLGLINESSWSRRGIITAVSENHVTINLNPPLAGKKAIYHLKIKDIKTS
ncbi:MAG: FKBP-type peptidyl-prolyl cis-trans isomerase [Candidatus Hodarchaeales archaeon]